MIETIATLNSLVLLSCCALALYGALVFRKHFGLVSPLWALAISVICCTIGFLYSRFYYLTFNSYA